MQNTMQSVRIEVLTYHQRGLEDQATEFLRRAGFRPDGRPRGERDLSIRAISTPCGGKPIPRKGK